MIVVRNREVILTAEQIDQVKFAVTQARRKGCPLVMGADWDVTVYPERTWSRGCGYTPRWLRRQVVVK